MRLQKTQQLIQTTRKYSKSFGPIYRLNEKICYVQKPFIVRSVVNILPRYMVSKEPIKLATGIIIDEKFISMFECVLSKIIVE